MELRRRRITSVAATVVVLGLVAVALLVYGPTKSSASTSITIQPEASELALAQSGTIHTTSLSCDQCEVDLYDCDEEPRAELCSQNECCCVYCGGQWGCWRLGSPSFCGS